MIIHLIAPSNKEEWKDVWVHCFESIKNLPYEIKLWDDNDIDNLIKNDNKEFFDIINQLHPIYKFDYARYLILYYYGGVYFDMDIEVKHNFIPLLNPINVYIAGGNYGDWLLNCIMISPSKHILWWNLKHQAQTKIIKNLEEAKNNVFRVGDLVGSTLMSLFLAQYPFDIQVLGFEHFISQNSDISFSKHWFTNTWKK